MIAECYPISILPHLSRLFLDFAGSREALTPFYPASAYSTSWMVAPSNLSAGQRATLCDLLDTENQGGSAGFENVRENLLRLRSGAGAVVTGQQVTLLGGPLFTLLKAATAIRKAKDASAAGHPHVPVFWLASEDHDLDEANHVTLPAGDQLRTLRLAGHHPAGAPVGGMALGEGIEQLLQQAAEILGEGGELGEIWNDLAACYRPEATFSEAFAGLIRRVFAPYGLIVIDASSRAFHALGATVLREAIVRAGELREALIARGQELAAAGYHSQVLVPPESSLLFLIDRETGARIPLRRLETAWAANRQTFSTEDLLAILDAEPERLSPNALLRPVFQDSILPTSAYIGGPSEIAYFAQSQALYECILSRTTVLLPRLSATLIEPAIASLLARHRISLPDVFEAAARDPLDLAQRLGARAMPVEAKRILASAGNALDEELSAVTAYMQSLNEDLGRAASVAASKMLYQMNRLRRMAANYQLNQERGLERDAQSILLNLFPNRHPQERVFGAIWFLSRYGDDLLKALVEEAGQECPGHRAIWL